MNDSEPVLIESEEVFEFDVLTFDNEVIVAERASFDH